MNEEIKEFTNGDKIRSMSDEELARLCIYYYSNVQIWYRSFLTEKSYTTFDKAYNANLEYLKQEYKGE